MIKILIGCLLAFTTSIYTIHFNDTDGVDRSFSAYQGKKILVVNIATGSPRIGQLAALQQLSEQYQDSLVVLVFPSNSFGNEPGTDSTIRSVCRDTWHTGFPIAAKASVKGPDAQSTYAWLADPAANGAMTGTVGADFQKFLISEEGNLIGVFAPQITPMDSLIINAIENN
jgi:glutathione peroxidase